MDTISVRQKLFEYIRFAEDEKVEAIYTLIKDEASERYEWWNDEEMVAELDQISADMDSGKDPGFTLEESMVQLKLSLKKNG
jgi:hypothetical protein